MTDKVYIIVEQFQDGDDGVAKCKTLCLNKAEAWALAFKNTCDFITKNGGKMHLLKDGPPVNMDDYDVSKDESGYHVAHGAVGEIPSSMSAEEEAWHAQYKDWVASFTVQKVIDFRPCVEFAAV